MHGEKIWRSWVAILVLCRSFKIMPLCYGYILNLQFVTQIQVHCVWPELPELWYLRTLQFMVYSKHFKELSPFSVLKGSWWERRDSPGTTDKHNRYRQPHCLHMLSHGTCNISCKHEDWFCWISTVKLFFVLSFSM